MRAKTQGPASGRRSNRISSKLMAGIAGLLIAALAPTLALAQSAKVEAFAKTLQAEKIHLNLLQLETYIQQRAMSFTQAATRMAMQASGEGVQVDILMHHIDEGALDDMRAMGLSIQHVSATHRRITAVVDNMAVLYDVARLDAVEMIMPEYGGATQRGAVDGRASEALLADIARTAMSLSGAGQTVGILSDSFARTDRVRDVRATPAAGVSGILSNSKPQQSGDLPPTVALRRDDFAGSDEGAAMAELVHDIAPGAAIAFHTAFGGQAVFAEGIADLCNDAGATVIVDDVLYFAEPMYQDGIIAQAAARCVASGAPYFSSAGNQSNLGLRQVFRDLDPVDDQEATPTGNDLHDWGGEDGFLDLTLPPHATVRVVLQWNQPFASISRNNGAQIDLDLYITRTPDAAGLRNPLASSIGLQGNTGNPRGDAVEIATLTNVTSRPMTAYIAIEHHDGSQEMIPQHRDTPLEFRLIFFASHYRQTQIQGITDSTSAFGGPTIYGHAVAPGVASVAAVPWFDTPLFDLAFGSSNAMDPEDFSSRGGAISVQFNTAGDFAMRTTQEPDITAVDGNNTTFFGFTLDLNGYEGEPDAFPNFFGTSAAAPNAAAVAALMREYHGAVTPAEILAAMVDTAIDVTGTRAAVGRDDVTGAGLIDANAAIGALQAEPAGVIDTPTTDVSINIGESVHFSGAGVSPDDHLPLSFLWDFGGGAANVDVEDPGDVVFNQAGTFVVTFIVSDSLGNSDSTPPTRTVTVRIPAAVSKSSGGGGGGGCALNPNGAADFTWLIALGGVMAYLAWRRRSMSRIC